MSLFRCFVSCAALALPLAIMLPAQAQQQPDWIPVGVEQLGRTAAFHTDFTFDRTMLQIAAGLTGDIDEGARQAIAKLNGVSVHSYRYATAGLYDPGPLELVRQQYHAAGWKHLVSTQSNAANMAESGYSGRTDLYIKFENTDVTGMVVLLVSPKNVNVVALTGDLSPLDLLHLRGHFGIPKFSGDGFVPARDN